jgi:glycosyltransferase involved in cell wall biosynthesis
VAEPFSLLLPVYAGDRPEHLRRAFTSSVHEQARRPAEVVLVRDGPVPAALEAELDALTASSPVPVRRVDLPRNAGLAAALEAGLAACRHDVVARMDADDVAEPRRFAVQVPLVEGGADIVGSALVEFADDDGTVLATRTPPLTQEAIAHRARFHSPFNHPTVVYRRAAVERAGGYRELPLLEDYWLFARMLAAGATAANVAEPLVRYRVGAGAYHRRGGLRLLRSEVALQRHLRAEGFTSTPQMVRNLLVRGGYRLVPVALRRRAYRRVFARLPGAPPR